MAQLPWQCFSLAAWPVPVLCAARRLVARSNHFLICASKCLRARSCFARALVPRIDASCLVLMLLSCPVLVSCVRYPHVASLAIHLLTCIHHVRENPPHVASTTPLNHSPPILIFTAQQLTVGVLLLLSHTTRPKHLVDSSCPTSQPGRAGAHTCPHNANDEFDAKVCEIHKPPHS